jgi:hypothetical protein
MLRAMLIQYKLLLGWKAKTLLQECEKVSLLLELQKVIEKLRLQLALEKAGKKAQVSSETQS